MGKEIFKIYENVFAGKKVTLGFNTDFNGKKYFDIFVWQKDQDNLEYGRLILRTWYG